MKLTLLTLILCISSVLAENANSQIARVNIQASNVQTKEIIKQIEEQTDYLFVYNYDKVDLSEKISVNASDVPVAEVLSKVFKNSDIIYAMEGNNILLMKRSEPVDQKGELIVTQENTRQIGGVVRDEHGDPIIGASIIVKGSTTGVVSDVDGNFSLIVGDKAVLEIRYIGYLPEEVVVGSKTNINVFLREDLKKLDEVIVVGYGTNSKRNLTSAVSTVDTDKLKNLTTSSVTDALAGRAAGLIVTKEGGGVNKKSSVSIRGGGKPIVVIDGIVSEYEDFENINSDDIESMSVLKDAASTAVYGARAGNGVLVIKTKTGIRGLRVNYSYDQSWSEPTYLEKKLNSYERAIFDNTVRDLYNLDPKWTADELEKYRTGSDPYNYPNVDWQKITLRNFAPESKHSLTVRGGSEFNRFYVSFQAYDQESMYKEKTDSYKRYNVRMNEISEFKEIGLTLTFGLDGYITNYRRPYSQYSDGYSGTWGHIQNKSPMELAYNQYGQLYAVYDHPLAEISPESGYKKWDDKMINGLFNAEWNVYGIEGLKLKAGGNYRFFFDDGKYWKKTATQYDLEGNTGPAYPVSLQYINWSGRMYTLQFFADYKRSFLDETHNVSATFGYEQHYIFYRDFSALRKNYIFMIDQMGAGPSDTMENSGSEAEEGRAGWVGKASYNYKKKYYIDGSFRRDGSDYFPKNKRWGTFLAGSAAYAISEEPFFQPLKDRNILNFFKVRVSYGQTGLDRDSGIGRFSYLPSYGLTERGYVLDGKIVPTFSEGALISDDITWYTIKDFDIGFDFNALGERLSGTFDYFYKKTTGYLTSPSKVGYTDPLGLALPNVKSDGEHRRAGYEFALAWKDNIGDLGYEVGANFTYFDQLVAVAWNEDLAKQKNPYKRDLQKKGYYTLGYKNLGYYTNSDDVMNAPRRDGSSNLVAGDIKYRDINGDGIIDTNDETYIGKNRFPRGNYGIFANLNYKGFFANLLFQGATSRDLYIEDVVRGQSTTGYTMVYPYQLDYWMPDNRNATFPRIAMNADINGNNNYQTSDFWLVNGKYFRLKSAQIGYDFRKKLLRNVSWLYKLEVVLSGQNLFTISPATKYGFDPENGSTNNYDYPIQRTYALSVNVGF